MSWSSGTTRRHLSTSESVSASRSSSSSPHAMPYSRPASPAPLIRSFRFSTHHDQRPQRLATGDESGGPHSSFPGPGSQGSAESFVTIADPFAAHATGTSSFVTYDPPASRPATMQSISSLPKRARGSLLLAATSLSFGRKQKPKPTPQPAPPANPLLLTEVIEISASVPHEDEDEERERLRDAAAQSIGIDPDILQERSSGGRHSEQSEADTEDAHYTHTDYIHHQSRTRSHSRSYSTMATTGPSVPPFPSTRAALAPFVQLAGSFPRHHSASSLLHFALSRQWKTRAVVLTSSQAVSYLHLFKNAGVIERELERLEINADSLVFVADEEVAGRRNVVRVVGVKRDGNPDENAQPSTTMWFLQISDAREAQQWISTIKSAVLSQRSVKAGLGAVHKSNGVEPRGDMDVMLSMHAQGLFSSPPPRDATSTTPTESSFPDGMSVNSSPSHTISHPHPRAVSALKGLFASRPRSASSASAAVSISSIPDTPLSHDDSFGSAGTNLMHMLRSTSISSERPDTPDSPVPSAFSLPATPRLNASPHLERKIWQEEDRQHVDWEPPQRPRITPIVNAPRRTLWTNSPFHFASSALQPPPRRRTMTASDMVAGPSSFAGSLEEGGPYTYTLANSSTAESLGVHLSNPSVGVGVGVVVRPPSPLTGVYSNGSGFTTPSTRTKDTRPRTAESRPRSSWSSVSSSFTTADRRSSYDKRRSRQGALPQQPTPPTGPPPATPSQSTLPISLRQPARHPYAAEGTSSGTLSLQSSPQSPQSPVSALHPQVYSKRASGGSVHSFATATSASHQRSNAGSLLSHHHPASSHRVSMPPPQRPPPSTALPPIPKEDPPPSRSPPASPSALKTSFRESFLHRGHRLSLTPPTLPPSSSLPPRPDEPGFRNHRRSSSGGAGTGTPLYSIPASPTHLGPPLPPPSGPLPPPPASTSSPTSAPTQMPLNAPAVAPRHSNSIARRLRMLSAPSSPPPRPPSPIPTPDPTSVPQTPTVTVTVPPLTSSTPHTPIGEPITMLQNDPNFLLGSPPAPVMPVLPPQTPLSDPSPEHEGVTSLSPPPRRASRRIGTPDKEKLELESTVGSDTPPADAENMQLPVTPLLSITLAASHPNISLLDVGA